MNRQLHYLCAAFLGAGMLHITPPLCAQDEVNQGVDVTKQYLKNAGFETNPTGVTTENYVYDVPDWEENPVAGNHEFYKLGSLSYRENNAILGQVPTNGSSVQDENNKSLLGVKLHWCEGVTIGVSQTATLPAGTYELTYDTYVTQTVENGTSWCGYSINGNTPSYKALPSEINTWENNSQRFSVTEENTQVTFTFGYTKTANAGGGNSPILFIDNIKLIYHGIDKSTLNSLIEEANALYQEGTAGAAALKSVIDAAQEIANKADVSQGEVSSAEEALAAAIKQYPFDNATPENPLDLTSYIKNPTMETATDWTWTGDIQNKALATNKTEAAVDGAFTGNFYEGWNRSKYTGGLSQTINGLVSGIYRLKAGAFNEAATESGVYLYGNEYETAVTSSNPMFYTVDIYVNNGTLTIGLRSDNNTTNWLGLDNVSLSYIGYDVMTVIDLIDGTINEALSLSNEKMQQEIQDNISYAILAIHSASTPEEIETAINDLTTSMAAAKASIQIYAAFKKIIDSYDAANYQGATLPAAIAEAKGAAESAYESAEKNNFSEEIAALNAAQASVVSLVISGNMSTLINDPTMDGGETATVWQHESNVPDQLNFQGLQTNDQYPGMNGWALEIYTNKNNGSPRTQKIYQTIENVPNGIYNISATAFAVYQKDDSKNQRKNGVALYANDKETEVPITWNTPNSQIYTVENVEVTNGTLELGLKATNAYCNWMVIDNVTLTKVDETLVLNETEVFNAPVAAATSVAYTRSAFSNNESTKVNHETLRGWQTICLPFDVTEISANDMTLLPIMDATFNDGVDETGNTHPFWLYAIDADGKLAPATEIKANVPYLMLVPNDPDFYAPFYNIPGDITFKGYSIAATDLQVQDGRDYDLLGYFGGEAENLPVQEGTTYYGLDAEGRAFVQTGFAPIASFQAFATLPTTPQAAPQTLSIFDDGDGQLTALPNIREALGDRASGIQVYTADGGIRIESAKAGSVTVYTVDGQALQTVALTAGGSEFVALPAGKYIVNGTVVIAQ